MNFTFQKRAGTFNPMSWAEEQLHVAERIFKVVSPVKTLNDLQQGDIMVSRSGNFRLVYGIDMQPDGDALIQFLTRTPQGIVRLESANRKKVDTRRVKCIIARQGGNPLGKFQALADGLSKDSITIRNIHALLLTGPQGEKIKGRLNDGNEGSDLIAVSVWVTQEGEIKSVGGEEGLDLIEVPVKINISGAPTEDYVKSASFYPSTPDLVKEKVLGACVFANTIANAHNFFETIQILDSNR